MLIITADLVRFYYLLRLFFWHLSHHVWCFLFSFYCTWSCVAVFWFSNGYHFVPAVTECEYWTCIIINLRVILIPAVTIFLRSWTFGKLTAYGTAVLQNGSNRPFERIRCHTFRNEKCYFTLYKLDHSRIYYRSKRTGKDVWEQLLLVISFYSLKFIFLYSYCIHTTYCTNKLYSLIAYAIMYCFYERPWHPPARDYRPRRPPHPCCCHHHCCCVLLLLLLLLLFILLSMIERRHVHSVVGRHDN